MQFTKAIPAVWVYSTSENYNTARSEGWGAFLTRDQQNRLERIRQARLLFDNKHREYFLEEKRTQFDFTPMQAGDRQIVPYLQYNALRLIAIKGTDLLIGSQPLLKVPSGPQQDAMNALAERSNLHQLFSSAATNAAYEAEAFFEACVFSGQVYLQSVPADEIFPVGRLRPDLQYPRYDRYALTNIGTDESPLVLVLITTYTAGRITRTLRQLDEKGAFFGGPRSLDQWPLNAGDPPLESITNTGIASNTITWVPNQLDRGAAVSDFDIGLNLQDALNAKQTQIARVLAKHADPKMAMPSAQANEFGGAYAGNDVFFFNTPDEVPKYVTWNAELAQAFADRDFALQNLLVATEISPVLLGIREGSHNDAYKKVKVQAMSSLKKAERKSVYWTVGIRRALSVAQDLENAIPGVRYDRAPIGVTLQDGFPNDELDEANRLSILRAAGGMSLRRMVEAQLDDPAAVEAELDELAKESAARTPSIFFGPGGGAPEAGGSFAADAGSLTDVPGGKASAELPGEGHAAAAAAANEDAEVPV